MEFRCELDTCVRMDQESYIGVRFDMKRIGSAYLWDHLQQSGNEEVSFSPHPSVQLASHLVSKNPLDCLEKPHLQGWAGSLVQSLF